MHVREPSGDERQPAEAPAVAAERPEVRAQRLFSAIGNAAVARMLQRAPAADTDAVRKDVLENVTNPTVEARVAIESTPPDYSKAFLAASRAESEQRRIQVTPNLPPDFQSALATNGPHIAAVNLEALDYNRGDIPGGVRSGINQTLHDLSPIAGPAGEKQLTGEGGTDHEAVRKDVLENITNPTIEARTAFESSPPDYSRAFLAASRAESEQRRIQVTPNLPPDFRSALATNGPHTARVQLEALDYSRGDLPTGARSGLNETLHALSPIAGPAAEKRIVG